MQYFTELRDIIDAVLIVQYLTSSCPMDASVKTSSAHPTDSQHFIKRWQQNHLSPLNLPGQ